jgi:hypothetical protein
MNTRPPVAHMGMLQVFDAAEPTPPQAPGRTPQKAPQAPLRCPGAEDRPAEAGEAPAREAR